MLRRARPLVLLVEDNGMIRDRYAEFLQMSGFDVLTAGDGVEALAQARQSQPDVILLDASLPRLDGWDTLRALKGDAHTRQSLVLMLTAHVFDEHRRRAAAEGADGFIPKPCLPAELTDEVRKALARAERKNVS